MGDNLTLEFTCRSLSITERLLWTLKAVTGSLYAELTNNAYVLFFVQEDPFVFFFLTQHYRTFHWGCTCKKGETELPHLLLHFYCWDWDYCTFLNCTFKVFLNVTRETWFSKPFNSQVQNVLFFFIYIVFYLLLPFRLIFIL